MKHEFGCEQCGHLIIAVSPDDIHTVFLINKDKEDCIRTVYQCDDCNKDIVRYWCKKGNMFGVTRGLI